MKQKEVIELIFKNHNPYVDFNIDNYLLDLQGWNGNHKAFNKVINEIKPTLILELGSWKGQSAVNISNITKKNNNNAVLICVDTWLGSSEHWNYDRDPKINMFSELKLINGYPSLYYQFLANVILSKCDDIIVPLPQTTTAAYEIFRRLKLEFDMIYLDAGHDYNSVSLELKLYWNILKSGGILIGDDITWDGVEKAVSEFAKEMNLEVEYDKPKYIIRKK